MCEKETNAIVFIYPSIVYTPKKKNTKRPANSSYALVVESQRT